MNRTILGKKYESLTEKHYQKNGYKLLEKNFFSRGGEIDLIFTKSSKLVFVEVRAGTAFSATYDPCMVFSLKKKRRILKTIRLFLWNYHAEHLEIEIHLLTWRGGSPQKFEISFNDLF